MTSNESTVSAAAVNPLPDIDFVVCDPNAWYRAKRRKYIPVVLSRHEIDAVITRLEPPYEHARGRWYRKTGRGGGHGPPPP